jgi:hypothetical protein
LFFGNGRENSHGLALGQKGGNSAQRHVGMHAGIVEGVDVKIDRLGVGKFRWGKAQLGYERQENPFAG